MIIDRFEESVYKYKDKTAIKSFDRSLTFSELNSMVNRIARKLITIDDKADCKANEQRIALVFEHGVDMIMALLAVLKASKIYVPLNSTYPEKRLEYMLRHSEANIIITNNKNINVAEKLAIDVPQDIVILNIENIGDDISSKNLNLKISQEQIAYLLYTSGSTGKPKAVIQTHRNILYFIERYTENLCITSNDNMTLFSYFSHDAAVIDIYGALLNGATLLPKDIMDDTNMSLLPRWIEEQEISIWHSVPTLYRYFGNMLKGSEDFSKLRYIVLGGEPVIKNDVDIFNKFIPNATLYNLYGQTESSYNAGQYIHSCANTNKITLGDVVEGTELIIVNEDGEEVEEFGTGEILVVSDHIALGYWKEPENTSKSFLHDNQLGRIYRTGDMGKIDYDGSIEYIGRIDNQVKIRGHRIEAGEIESSLLKHHGVKEAVVLAKEDSEGDRYLCGYVVVDKEEDVKELRNHLSRELPDYMIPSYFVKLEEMPLTPNGKINRKALEEFEVKARTEEEYEAPRNEIEAKLVNIWKEVLKIDRVGINDNFFDLGGHSLKATNLIAKIHKELKAEVLLREAFKRPTIKKLSEYIRRLEESIYSSIEPVEEREYYPLSSVQRRMYTLQRLELEGTNYNMPGVMSLEGVLDRDRLDKAFNKLVNRHESLRTSFEIVGDEPVQIIHKDIEFKIENIESDEEGVEEIIQGFIKSFDLSKAPLLRVGLIKLEEERHILIFDMHHIISDGTSMSILIKEFTEVYRDNEPTKLRIQYKDYSVWQREILNKDIIKQQEQYWLERFKGEIPVLNIPTDYLRPSIKEFEGESIDFKINKEVAKEMKKMAKQIGASLYMVILAGYNILLSKYSGQEDIVVGSPIAGRPHADIENTIGMFVNTLAMRNFPEGNKTFMEFLEEVKKTSLQAYENQDYQFEELVDKLDITRDMSRNPLFDTMLVLQNMDMESLKLEELSIKPYEYENRTAKFDISLYAVEVGEEIKLNIEYRTKLFARNTIEKLSKHFVKIFEKVMVNPEIRLREIEILTEEEKKQISVDFNNTAGEYPRDKTLQELFEEQVEKTPNNTAVIFEKEKLSYRKLNERVNRLHWLFKKEGVKEGDVIGIMIPRSIELIISLIGILKAGGVVLYIDPEYPEDRKNLLIEDSKTKLVLKTKDYALGLNVSCSILDFSYETLSKYDKNNPKAYSIDSNSLAYLIYTSGSTGKPKGVMLKHRGINNHIFAKIQELQITVKDKLCSSLSNNFVASIWQIWTPFFLGAELVIYPERIIYDSYHLFEKIQEDNISILEVIPSLLNQYLNLIKEGNRRLKLQNLRSLILTGERVDPELVNKFYNRYKILLVNAYGQSECSDDTLHYKIPYDTNTSIVPIGVPTLNTRAYIVNRDNKLQPIGVPGELCIGGAGIAMGYLNRPELTTEKFIQTPFILGEMMYKTGDLARWLPGGNIEFLGRIDNQVKIRGYRIELGEIESSLLKHKGVKEAVVLAREDKEGNRDLCGYIVGDEEVILGELRRYLALSLPYYMIPAYFTQLEKLPLTPNGKIDRKALEKLELNIKIEVEYEEPRNEKEEKLAQIWSEVLELEKIGINDNFFEIGGNSINIIKIVTRIDKEFNIRFPIGELFMTPTIKEIARKIDEETLLNKLECIIKLNNSKKEKNIFIIHGLDGDAYYYKDLAKLINEDCNVYGIGARGLIREAELPSTPEEMLNQYIVEIKQIQKEGPYIIAGYCVGAILAYEMVRMLEDEGDKIEKLIILDEHAFIPDFYIEILSEYGVIDDQILEELAAKYKEVAAMDDIINNYINDFQEKFSQCSSLEIADNRSLTNKERVKSNIDHIVNKRYIPRRIINTPTYIIKAKENNYPRLTSEHWSRMVNNKIELFEITGSHKSILKYPDVKGLADVIKNIKD